MDPFTNCNRKPPYPDKAAAQQALRDMKRRLERRGEKLQGSPQAYHCKMGSHWHIGRINGRRGR